LPDSPFWRAEAWVRRELDPFYGPRFISANAIPCVLAAALSAWFFGFSGLFGSYADGSMAFEPKGIMNFAISLWDLGAFLWVLNGGSRRRLAEMPFWLPAACAAVLFLYARGYAVYCGKAAAAYLFGLYFLNRLRHIFYSDAKGAR
jgi:hypothetical protein